MNNIITNYYKLKEQIEAICKQNMVSYLVEVIAVSKTFPDSEIRKLHTHTNQKAFGENYVRELQQKSCALTSCLLQWHFIGNIQSNKIKYIANNASWVHSLNCAKHALLLNKKRNVATKLNILIEINISHEPGKHGLTNFNEIIELAGIVNTQENLVLRGLMGISGVNADNNTKNQQFSELRQLFNQLKATSGYENIDTLSMGMSDDYELAIKNGATMIRIGSLIFGERK
ncbi:MAG: YggS family pyridoxal phosphate-dependent enzyme [Burkholderiales bacterium]|jgi:pyridoxal phosphate enzyme (YggS family)|nr:YggS family pyridoxal phosphate-dependent enzyme [Burkholderiales bacterium]